MGLQGFWCCFDSHDGKDLVLGAHHVNGSWWVLSKFGFCNFLIHIYIYIYCLVQPLFCKEITGHTRKWVEENQPNIEQSLVKRFEGKHFLDFFFSQDQIFLFSVLLGKAMVLMPFVDQVVVMMLERGKKKDKWRENLKFLWKLETDAGGRKRYGLFSPWIFYLPSVSHPNKNGRQQEMLKLERSLSHQKPPGTAMNLHQSTKNHL